MPIPFPRPLAAVLILIPLLSTPAVRAQAPTPGAAVPKVLETAPAGFVRWTFLLGDTPPPTVLTLISNEEAPPLEIVRVECPAEWIKVTHKKIEKAEERVARGHANQHQYRLEFTVDAPRVKVGILTGRFKVVTNSKTQPELLIPLSGAVRPAYRLIPTSLDFKTVTFGDTGDLRTVVVKSNRMTDPQSFKVLKAETNLTGLFTVKLTPTDIPGEYMVVLQIEKTAPAGPFEGKLKVQTNDPLLPVSEVTVKGTIKGAGA